MCQVTPGPHWANTVLTDQPPLTAREGGQQRARGGGNNINNRGRKMEKWNPGESCKLKVGTNTERRQEEMATIKTWDIRRGQMRCMCIHIGDRPGARHVSPVYECRASCWGSASASHSPWILISHMGKSCRLFSITTRASLLINSATRGHLSLRIIKVERVRCVCGPVCDCVSKETAQNVWFELTWDLK